MPKLVPRAEFAREVYSPVEQVTLIPDFRQRLGMLFYGTPDDESFEQTLKDERKNIDDKLKKNWAIGWKRHWAEAFLSGDATTNLSDAESLLLANLKTSRSVEEFAERLELIDHATIKKLLPAHWERVKSAEIQFKENKQKYIDQFFESAPGVCSALFPNLSQQEIVSLLSERLQYIGDISFVDPLDFDYEVGKWVDVKTTAMSKGESGKFARMPYIIIAAFPEFQQHALFHELVHALLAGRTYVEYGGVIKKKRESLSTLRWLNEGITEFITLCLLDKRPVSADSMAGYVDELSQLNIYPLEVAALIDLVITKGVGLELLLHGYCSDLEASDEVKKYTALFEDIRTKLGTTVGTISRQIESSIQSNNSFISQRDGIKTVS